jgi:hypothetical protein
VNTFHKGIIHLWDDRQFNEKDLPYLDKIKRNISNAYSRGKINNEHYVNLNNEISMSYREIMKTQISFLKNINKRKFNQICR